ncbi:hypothetical protein AhnVgp074 [Adoxophyes honmai nucleopolyhedrovirus]|uniref:38K n=1 Tax=Adoxophyes honmai nucleopolyhedrovirus TaxID=224399 RepID=Q80LM2_NPVAH|nr:hypothetical protein AhnVgp074 [Adoxophyes honmai nucleopolyhedrovirus]BAC67325.1 hypothetical protein [Adoxophyes honmai nucleopolyhedrovirus]
MECLWTVLKHRNPLLRKHILVLSEYDDLIIVGFDNLKYFEYVLFVFDKNVKLDTHNYMCQLLKCEDNMQCVRRYIKMAYKTPVLGHVYVINERKPMYNLLKEWYVQNYVEVYQLATEKLLWSIPHVIVFDLDETLITSENQVQIRDKFVYTSLQDLHDRNCVLILWSYGNTEHVSASLKETELEGYFDIVLSGGNKKSKFERRTIVYSLSKTTYVKKPFYLDHDYDNSEHIPKSPRVPLWYMRKCGINYYKTITLVDDLTANDHSYDYFVNVNRCSQPITDWHRWHQIIVDNIEDYDNTYSI